MEQRPRQLHIFTMLPAIVALLAGCASRDAADSLPFQEAPGFSIQGEDAIEVRWWSSLQDPALDAAIERALKQNFSLKAATRRLEAARALARRQSATLWPELDFVGGGEQSESTGGGSRESESVLELGLAAAYEVDLWGRLDALAEAETLRADVAEALLEVSALSLSAEVAVTWYRLAGARAQKEVLRKQLSTNRTVEELLEARFERGQIRAADVLRQRQLVEATLEQLSDVEAQISVLQHLLATLQGTLPQVALDRPEPELIALPPLPAPGLPSELLQRRPDVREAFLRVQAADAELAAAVSARYPRINLTLDALTSDRAAGTLFETWLTRAAGELALPLIDGGRRRAEVDQREARLGEEVALYGQAVLTAFREVEDALVREYHQKNKVTRLTTQLRLAEQTSNQLRSQYLNGVSDYIEVLDALREQQILARELVAARQALIEIRIALHRALAGDFLNEPKTFS
jgi:NodT family efflux transporter outer membrane factor (OMF) lipoprotein